ncbi:hypothetical protein THAOC_22562, partial [Thalassiosira oceanica]
YSSAAILTVEDGTIAAVDAAAGRSEPAPSMALKMANFQRAIYAQPRRSVSAAMLSTHRRRFGLSYSLVCAPPEEPEEAAGDVMAAAAGEASGGGVPSGQRWEEGRPSSAPPR